MVEKALVEKVKGKKVYVGLNKKPECDTCKACVFGKNQKITITAYSEVDCKPGDTVKIRMPEKSIMSASLLLYALPLAFLIGGMLIGGMISSLMQIVLAFVFLGVSFVGVWLLDRFYFRNKPQYNAMIVEAEQIDSKENINIDNEQEPAI